MTDLIPPSAIEKHIAFLGATGSGKTSAAKRGLVEPALDAGRRVCILDPTGAWWGLRLKADGKGKGYPIYIFGGDHADYPLRARNWLDGRTGYKRSSRDAYLQRLSARELIDLPGGMPRASASLFD